MNEIYINGNLVVTEVGSSVTPQAEYVQDAWAIAGEPIQLGGDDITLTLSEQVLIQKATEAAKRGYAGCYRTSNVQPVKPTKPGFYWYNGPETDHEWKPVRCQQGIVTYIGTDKFDLLERMFGEWGPEIVHE